MSTERPVLSQSDAKKRLVARLPNPIQLAATLPAGESATVGAMPILTIAVAFTGSWLSTRIALRNAPLRSLLRERSWVLALLVVVGLGVIVIDLPFVGVGAAVTSYLLFAFASWLGFREGIAGSRADRNTTRLRGARLGIALAVMYALAAAAYGFGGRLGPAGAVVARGQDLFRLGITSG